MINGIDAEPGIRRPIRCIARAIRSTTCAASTPARRAAADVRPAGRSVRAADCLRQPDDAAQKMADVALEPIPHLLERHPRLQFAVIGRASAASKNDFRRLARICRIAWRSHIGYDEAAAHRCTRAPTSCCTAPLRALRPHADLRDALRHRAGVPRASAGLADTIVDHTFHQNDAPTGFLFDGETAHDVIAGATRAIDAFMRPQQWRTLQRNAMSRGYGWSPGRRAFRRVCTPGLTDARPAKSALGTTGAWSRAGSSGLTRAPKRHGSRAVLERSTHAEVA